MQKAIEETNRRRALQTAYNEEHGITPATIVKAVYNLERQQAQAVEDTIATIASGLPPDEIQRLGKDLGRQMKKAARDLQFERAAELRDPLPRPSPGPPGTPRAPPPGPGPRGWLCR